MTQSHEELYQIETLIQKQLTNLIWRFELEDVAMITASWPHDSEWSKIEQKLRFVHSFNFFFHEHIFTCILHPAKRRITITIDYKQRCHLYDLINVYNLKIDWKNFDEEIRYLEERRRRLVAFKMKLNTSLSMDKK